MELKVSEVGQTVYQVILERGPMNFPELKDAVAAKLYQPPASSNFTTTMRSDLRQLEAKAAIVGRKVLVGEAPNQKLEWRYYPVQGIFERLGVEAGKLMRRLVDIPAHVLRREFAEGVKYLWPRGFEPHSFSVDLLYGSLLRNGYSPEKPHRYVRCEPTKNLTARWVHSEKNIKIEVDLSNSEVRDIWEFESTFYRRPGQPLPVPELEHDFYISRPRRAMQLVCPRTIGGDSAARMIANVAVGQFGDADKGFEILGELQKCLVDFRDPASYRELLVDIVYFFDRETRTDIAKKKTTQGQHERQKRVELFAYVDRRTRAEMLRLQNLEVDSSEA